MRIAWADYYICIIRVFSRPPIEEVVYQCHASFLYYPLRCWRRNQDIEKMNECVQQFIDRRKKEIAEERKKVLAKIPEFQRREYSGLKHCDEKYPLWDLVKQKPYKISAVVDVSEDDFEKIRKYLPKEEEDVIKTEDEGMVKPSNAADKTLSVLAVICLVFAFIGLIVGFVGLSDIDSYFWEPTILIIGFSAFVVLLIEWATLRLFVNISFRLRQINNNLIKTL